MSIIIVFIEAVEFIKYYGIIDLIEDYNISNICLFLL